jgi:[ribosomal protein S18]-alanine N-acetyltransferase
VSGVRAMEPRDVARLHLRYDSLFNRVALQEHVRDYPGLSWTNDHYEYVVAARWKSRDAIIDVLELSGPGRGFRGLLPAPLRDSEWPERRTALLEGLLGSLRARGCRLVLVGEKEAERSVQPFVALGFEPVEDIVYYRKPDANAASSTSRLTLRPLRSEDIPELVELERRVFPWLWWYGDAEWYLISLLAGVETNLAYLGDRLIGYETHTVNGYHGHLDRLGVDPAMQGQHLGEEMLLRATRRIHDLGARDVGLSTQRSNLRARRLYEKHGFRISSHSLRYYGYVLDPAARALVDIPAT